MRLNSDLRRSAHKVLNSHGKSWCPGAESNHRHRDFQSRALPTELPGRRPRNEGSRSAGRYRGWVRPCPATAWAPARPCSSRPSVRLLIARAGLVRLTIILLRRRDRVTAAQPAMQVDIGAAPRAERAKLLDVRLSADRAGFRGLGGRAQWVRLSCGNRRPRCHRPVGWHLWAAMASMAFAPWMPPLFAMASTAVSPSVPSHADVASTAKHGIGVCTNQCHLAPGWHLRQKMASTAFAPSIPSRADMASMARHGIYGGHGIYGRTWHLWRDMASMAPAPFAKCASSGRGVDPAEMDRIALARQQ
jgi:hypothetical protein